MPNVQITTEVSTDELLHSVSGLPAKELDQFVSRVLAIRAKLKAPSLSDQETKLLNQINNSLNDEQQHRWTELEAKRQGDALTSDEQYELICLNDVAEQQNVERIKALSALAQLRQRSLPELMSDLAIKAQPYG